MLGCFIEEIDMKIEAFLLCDAATDQRGKLNVLGAFEDIYVQQVPFKYPACAIVSRIRFEKIEEGEHKIRLTIIDQDGNSIGPKPEGKLVIKTAPNRDSSVANLIMNIQGLDLQDFGKYRVDLAIDGSVQASLPLRVNEIPNQSNN